MSKAALSLPPGWAPSSLAAAPVVAEHGDRCACRHCASGAYADLLQKSDYQRHEITRLTAELNKTKFALSLEKYRRLTLVIERAIERRDQATWQKAVAERMELGVAVMDAAMQEAA